MAFEATVRKSASPEEARRNAALSSYEGSLHRLKNARKRLHAAIIEYEAAVAECDITRDAIQEYHSTSEEE